MRAGRREGERGRRGERGHTTTKVSIFRSKQGHEAGLLKVVVVSQCLGNGPLLHKPDKDHEFLGAPYR